MKISAEERERRRQNMLRVRQSGPGRNGKNGPPTFKDLEVLARTIYGEARGEPLPGKLAVARVVLNRARHKQRPIWKTCLKPGAFSCWSQTDLNYRKLTSVTLADPVFVECVSATLAALAPSSNPSALPEFLTPDTWHYHTVGLKPYWVEDHLPVGVLGRHVFYRGIPF